MTTVFKYQDTVADAQTGRPIANVAITVFDYPSGSPSTLYHSDGTISTGPVTTDSNGYFCFYAAVGNYNISIASNAAAVRTLTDVPIGQQVGLPGPKGDTGPAYGGVIVVSSYASLTAAVAAIGSTVGELLLDVPTTLTANTTVPATLAIRGTQKGTVNQGSYTLAINGAFEAGCVRVFTGPGAVTFGPGTIREVVADWFGATADGTTDNQAALTTAANSAANSGAPLYLPPGKYGLASTWALPSWLVVRGSGKTAWNGGGTVLYALSGFTGNGVIDLSRNSDASKGYANTLQDFNIDVAGRAGIHGLYASDANAGPTQLDIQRLYILNAGGSGIRFDTVWTASIKHVTVDLPADHNFFIGNSSTYSPMTLGLEECYAKRPAAGKCGYRIVSGYVTLRNCNGVDPGPGGYFDWGVFGGRIADGDPINANAYVTMEGCNIEDFSRYGVFAKWGSVVNFRNCGFWAPVSGIVAAIRMDYPITQGATYDGSNRINTKGATWANGEPIHTGVGGSTPPFLAFGNVDFTHNWVDSGTYTGAVASGGYDAQLPILINDAGSGSLRWRGGVIFAAYASSQGTPIIFHGSTTGTIPTTFTLADGTNTDKSGQSIGTVTISGAAVGMTTACSVTVNGSPLPAGMWAFAMVTAANTVKITIFNQTGASQTLTGPIVFRVDVWGH